MGEATARPARQDSRRPRPADLRMTLKTYALIRPEDLAAPLNVLAGVERAAREDGARTDGEGSLARR